MICTGNVCTKKMKKKERENMSQFVRVGRGSEGRGREFNQLVLKTFQF